MAELRITAPDVELRTFPLATGSVWLGRSLSCELSYPEDAGLSRRHLQLEDRQGHWYLIDGGSLNGTELNGVLITEPQELNTGDKISAGHLVVEFILPAVQATDPWEGIAAFAAQSAPDPTVSYYQAPGPPAELISLHLDAAAVAADPASLALDLCLEVLRCDSGVLVIQSGNDWPIRARRGGPFRIELALRERVMTGEALSVKTPEGSLAMVPLVSVPGFIYLEAARTIIEDELNLLAVVADAAAQRLQTA